MELLDRVGRSERYDDLPAVPALASAAAPIGGVVCVMVYGAEWKVAASMEEVAGGPAVNVGGRHRHGYHRVHLVRGRRVVHVAVACLCTVSGAQPYRRPGRRVLPDHVAVGALRRHAVRRIRSI